MTHSKFEKLNTTKKTIIINAAIKTFEKNGFDKASTNEIVKQANISKGSLFNYFNNKKNLFLYLIDYSVQILEEMYEKIDLNETDLFKRIENVGFQKLKVQKTHPEIFDFLKSTVNETSIEVKPMIESKLSTLYEHGMQKIYSNIDYSKFRDDIDIEKATEILNWTMLGSGDKAMQQIETFEDISQFGDQYLKEWNAYAQILKRAFYK